MGHINGKDIYRKLGKKIDNLPTRAPWNKELYAILKELYSPEEADIVVKMPFGLSTIDRIERVTRLDRSRLESVLETLCNKGLVMDLWANNHYYYAPSPMVIGIFEFTMMRTGDKLNTKAWAHLFHDYLEDNFFMANFSKNEKISIMRSLPHEGAVAAGPHIEVLDYERATALIEAADKFAIGLCSCRHEKHHLGEKRCEVPLESCTSFGPAADYLIRRKMAQEISMPQMKEHFARSKELGLVLNADNVQRNISFVCHCCSCCCHPLLGIKKFGYENIVVSTNYLPQTDHDTCNGCGNCARACPIDAVEMIPIENPKAKKKKSPRTHTDVCLGCGVCALKCKSGALTLEQKDQRWITPETTFQRLMLQCLERGTLQNMLFDNPQSISQKFLRGFVGATLKLPPVKRTLMSDTLRSSFLKFMERGVEKQGNGWLTK